MKEKLRYENLTDDEKKIYDRSVENHRIEMSAEHTRVLNAKYQKAVENTKNGISKGYDNQGIADITGLSID